MADAIRTIGSTTGDEASIGDAITWGQNSANYDRATSDDRLILEIVDSEEFDENITLASFTGTPTASKYVLLTTAAGARHAGVWDTGKAYITSSAGTETTYLQEDYAMITYCQIGATGFWQ